jgi:isopentenyldiphosphate isomerase
VYFYLVMDHYFPEELFPVVDENGNEISTAPRTVCHDGKSKLLHPVVHLHLLNDKGELFLQKRAMTKDLLPGMWDTSVGGHISPGESIEEALKRETLEELGLKNFRFRLLGKYIWESQREREYVYSFRGSTEDMPVINREEIDEGSYWTLEEIRNNLGKDVLTPDFEYEFDLYLQKPGIMKRTVKILELESEIEAKLLSGLLEQRGIPHMLRSYHDSAYDGVWQTQTSWGSLDADEENREEILKIYYEMSKPENLIDPE